MEVKKEEENIIGVRKEEDNEFLEKLPVSLKNFFNVISDFNQYDFVDKRPNLQNLLGTSKTELDEEFSLVEDDSKSCFISTDFNYKQNYVPKVPISRLTLRKAKDAEHNMFSKVLFNKPNVEYANDDPDSNSFSDNRLQITNFNSNGSEIEDYIREPMNGEGEDKVDIALKNFQKCEINYLAYLDRTKKLLSAGELEDQKYLIEENERTYEKILKGMNACNSKLKDIKPVDGDSLKRLGGFKLLDEKFKEETLKEESYKQRIKEEMERNYLLRLKLEKTKKEDDNELTRMGKDHLKERDLQEKSFFLMFKGSRREYISEKEDRNHLIEKLEETKVLNQPIPEGYHWDTIVPNPKLKVLGELYFNLLEYIKEDDVHSLEPTPEKFKKKKEGAKISLDKILNKLRILTIVPRPANGSKDTILNMIEILKTYKLNEPDIEDQYQKATIIIFFHLMEIYMLGKDISLTLPDLINLVKQQCDGPVNVETIVGELAGKGIIQLDYKTSETKIIPSFF